MALLEPAAPCAGVGGGRDRRARRGARCSARRASTAPLRWLAAGLVARRRGRARAARGRRRRRVPAPRPLGRAARRRGAGDRGAPGRARALPRRRRVDADRDRRPAGRCWSVVAALLAFWPRRGRTGFPAVAVLALVTLYVVPAVVLDFEGEFLRGAVLALLLLAFLRLEKLRVRDAPAAGVAAVGRRDPGARRGPGARRARPVVGLRELGARDGRREDRQLQLGPRLQPAGLAARRARAAAREGALPGLLEGGRPRPVRRAHVAPRPAPARRARRASSCRSPAPASRAGPSRSRSRCATCRRTRSSAPGSRRRSSARPATRSAAASSTRPARWAAATPTPPTSTRRCRPSASCARAGAGYEDWLRSYTSVLPPRAAAGRERRHRRQPPGARARVLPVLGHGRRARGGALRRAPRDGGAGARAGPISRGRGRSRRSCARGPRRRSSTSSASRPTSTTASPTPRRRRGPRPRSTASCSTRRIGFCQQFSGAEALLLRMGGIPARVATGFTSGSFDEKQQEYVVRDLDAHSWVEVWFPELRLGEPRPDAGERAAARRSPARTRRASPATAARARRTSAASA